MFCTLQGQVQEAKIEDYTPDGGEKITYLTIYIYDKDAYIVQNKLVKLTIPLKVLPKSVRQEPTTLEGSEIKLIGTLSNEPVYHIDKNTKEKIYKHTALKFRCNAIADLNGDLLTD